MKNNTETFPVILSIAGRNRGVDNQEEMDTVRLMTTGIAEKTDKGWQLDYEETDPESGAKQFIQMQLTPGSVSMMRKGPYGTTMVFEKDKRFEGYYNTPYGSLTMGVFATRVHWTMDGEKGLVELKYQLDLQGNFSAVHELSIRFARNG